MKINTKRFILPTIIIIIAMLATGCGKNSGNKGKDPDDYVKITENLYVHWINDIYTNIDEYEGKTIEIDGMFSIVKDPEVNKDKYYVFRVGPGCCANDGAMCGFEFQSKQPMNYKEQEWIKVKGKLKTYEQGTFTYLCLMDCKVTKLSKPQQSVVSQ